MTINTKESGCMGWLVALGILFLIGKGCGDDETDLGKDSYRSSSASYLYSDTMRHTDTSSLDTWPGNENRRQQSIGPTKHRPQRIPAAEHHYIRGPRGGCYYINSHGNKVYVDRSLCN